VATVTAGMLPEAEFAFLDELFNANSAILNNLLGVLNERVYRRGAEVHKLPLLSLYSASNQLAEDEELRALFDRFLLRCHVGNLRREVMPELLAAGWALETPPAERGTISADDLRRLSRKVFEVDLAAISGPYADLVWKVRDLGIALSDRRAVKVLKLVAASALLCGRRAAAPTDLWVLRYTWDREEQIDPLASLVNGFLEQVEAGADGTRHTLSRPPERADAEELARELEAVEAQSAGEGLTLSAIARMRERVGDLADRAAWVADESGRRHLLRKASDLMGRLK
jgi:MoxR-like ATPase